MNGKVVRKYRGNSSMVATDSDDGLTGDRRSFRVLSEGGTGTRGPRTERERGQRRLIGFGTDLWIGFPLVDDTADVVSRRKIYQCVGC